MGRKKRQRKKYTRLGERMAELGKQVELAKALKVSQQTISKKLRGECAISVSDLEKLARKFKRHMMWFFQDWKF
ncbi:MAG: helix-turn-helix transcriptional regulator [Planctomycetota bacterium]|jgi:transcriptional regulator with XRE-family HTH domain